MNVIRLSCYFFLVLTGGCTLLTTSVSKESQPLHTNSQPEMIPGQSDNQSLCRIESLDSLDVLGLPVVRSPKRRFAQFLAIAEAELRIDPNLKAGQRNSSNYSVQVRERKQLVYVLFSPRDRGQNPSDGSGETEIARDILYTMCKADKRIIDRIIFK